MCEWQVAFVSVAAQRCTLEWEHACVWETRCGSGMKRIGARHKRIGQAACEPEVGWGVCVGVGFLQELACLIMDHSRRCVRLNYLSAHSRTPVGGEQGRGPMYVCDRTLTVGEPFGAVRCGGCERSGADVCVHCVGMGAHASTWELWVGGRVRRAGDPWEVWRVGTGLRGCTKGEAVGRARGWCRGGVGWYGGGVPAASVKLG